MMNNDIVLFKLPMPVNRQLYERDEFIPVFEAFAAKMKYNLRPQKEWNDAYFKSFGCKVFHTVKEWIDYIKSLREWRHYEDAQTISRYEKLERFAHLLEKHGA